MFSHLVSIAVFAVTMVSSKPLAARQGRCTPNFQGQAVSIHVVETGTKYCNVDGVTSFFIQQDGQDPANFIIRDAANPNRAVTASGNNLDLKPASNAGNEQDQLFEFACANCAPDGIILAKTCTIQAKGQNLCFDGGSNNLQPCNGGNNQSFDIYKN
ncbi:hypothetical protein AAF712_008069 [Marasmius tenuissimus]|uniref:Sodefrin-like factor n=1 Tax=Marasmius tenuissimus TaxID=585030 RepID=A0ABR2ZXD7_9AGAR